MPEFQFAATDSGGHAKRGTIDAPTKADAVAGLIKRGLKVTQINRTDDPPATSNSVPDWYVHQEASSAFRPELVSDGYQPAHVKSASPPLWRRIAMTPSLLSGLAVLLALVSLVVALTRDSLGKGINGYDFSTPEAGTKSMMLIQLNMDVRAERELAELNSGGDFGNAIRTLEINRVADVADKKIVFFSYLRAGRKRKRLLGFEKNLNSKLWVPKSISPFAVKKINEPLAKEMEAWTADSDEPD